MKLGPELGGLRSNYLRKQPSLAAACVYTGCIAGEAGNDEESPHTAAGQHRPTRSVVLACPGHTEPCPVLSRAKLGIIDAGASVEQAMGRVFQGADRVQEPLLGPRLHRARSL